jgi:hypothetical protein
MKKNYFTGIFLTAFAIFGQSYFSLAQYCTPLYVYGCIGDDAINSVLIPGANSTQISDLNTACSITGYDNKTNLSVTLNQNTTYTATISSLANFNFISIWIDYNNDNTFSGSERLVSSAIFPSGTAVSLVISPTAALGTHRMRIRLAGSFTTFDPNNIDPCTSYDVGETHDYTVVIATPPACTGQPVAGSISSSLTNACSYPVSFVATGFTSGAGNLLPKWQSSPMGLNTWSDIPGATSTTLSLVQTSSSDYRFIMKCNSSGLSDTSNVVTVIQNPAYQCYCSPITGNVLHTSPGGNSISNLTILNTTFNSSNSGVGNDGYTQVSPTPASNTASLGAGLTYNLTITKNGNPITVRMWIDYNINGIFEASESTPITITTGNTVTGAGVATFTIPVTATSGMTGLRIRSTSSMALNDTSACTTLGSGETEDYVISIFQPAACSSTPVAGTASSTVGTACPSTAFTLTLSGYTNNQSGTSIQWQSRPTGQNSWTNISLANNAVLNITGQTSGTDYRAYVRCNNTNQADTSNVVVVAQTSYLSCYCSSTANAPGQEDIFNVTFGSLFNTQGCVGSGGTYSDFTSLTPPGMAIGSTYPFYATIGSCGSANNSGVRVYIDWNHDSDFDDPNETAYTSASFSSSITGVTLFTNITIPAGATTGITRMRVVAVQTSNPGSILACGTYTYGETEDYNINVLSSVACPQPSGPTVLNITATSAKVNWHSLSIGTTYEYFISTGSTPPSSGTSTPDTFATVNNLLPMTLYYVHIRATCGAGFSNWTTFYFTTKIINDDAAGAILLTVNSPCSGNPYTNVGATQGVTEPYTFCSGTSGFYSVWYKFVAPASGSVKISNDFSGGTLGQDTRIALFSVADSSNYNTFTIIHCDDQNGVVSGSRSIMYAVNLTPGAMYYIEVDGGAQTTIRGTFCLEVSELNSSMISTETSCAQGQANNIAYTYLGWTSVADNTGKLVYNIRRITSMTGSAQSYSERIYRNTGAVRTFAGTPYLDRNYQGGGPNLGSNFDIQFFFTATELAALQAVDPLVSLGNIALTRQSVSACQTAFSSSAGATTFHTQTGSGTSNGANWTQFVIPGFSASNANNFFLHKGANALAILIKEIEAKNFGNYNSVLWSAGDGTEGYEFIIERSAEGISFKEIGKIKAVAGRTDYKFNDQAPHTGINYYRIKLADLSGGISYSKVVTAILQSSGSFVQVFPNPSHDQITVLFSVDAVSPEVSINDITGREVAMYKLDFSGQSININNLPAGVYLLKYKDAAYTETIRLVRD